MTIIPPPSHTNHQLKLPAYSQVYVTVRDWIVSGHLSKGIQLPTEAELGKTFNVSRITVRKAVELLQKEALVSRERGRGTFVIYENPHIKCTVDMSAMITSLHTITRNARAFNVKSEEVSPDEETRSNLQLEQDAKVKRLEVTRVANDIRIGRSIAYIESSLVEGLTQEDFATNPFFRLVVKKGIPLRSADQLLGATLSSIEDATALDIQVGVPLLQLRMVIYTDDEKPVICSTSVYRGDHYQHHVKLENLSELSEKQGWHQAKP